MSSLLGIFLCPLSFVMLQQNLQTFSIVAIYTDFFLRLLRGGILPRLAAYSSTKKLRSTAN